MRDHLSTQKGPSTEALRGAAPQEEAPGGRPAGSGRVHGTLPPPFRKRRATPRPDHVENGSKNQNHMHPNEGEDGNTDVQGRGYAGHVHGDLLGTVLGRAGRAERAAGTAGMSGTPRPSLEQELMAASLLPRWAQHGADLRSMLGNMSWMAFRSLLTAAGLGAHGWGQRHRHAGAAHGGHPCKQSKLSGQPLCCEARSHLRSPPQPTPEISPLNMTPERSPSPQHDPRDLPPHPMTPESPPTPDMTPRGLPLTPTLPQRSPPTPDMTPEVSPHPDMTPGSPPHPNITPEISAPGHCLSDRPDAPGKWGEQTSTIYPRGGQALACSHPQLPPPPTPSTETPPPAPLPALQDRPSQLGTQSQSDPVEEGDPTEAQRPGGLTDPPAPRAACVGLRCPLAHQPHPLPCGR